MQLPHKYLQRVLQRILPLLDSLSVQSTHRTNINVYRLFFVGGEALGTLCTQPKHGRIPFGGNANLETFRKKSITYLFTVATSRGRSLIPRHLSLSTAKRECLKRLPRCGECPKNCSCILYAYYMPSSGVE